MDFKIIAVKPLNKCTPTLLKTLNKEQYYYLYNNYHIENNKISYRNEQPVWENLYTLKNGTRVNISAIVGKNGSGKSSIVELMYAVVYNAAHKFRILPKKDDLGLTIEAEKGIYASLYYKKGENYYWLKCEDTKISFFEQKKGENRFKSLPLTRASVRHLFFTIAMNYSHHGLNSRHMGRWIKHIFYKNDGYQTPVVINPFRNEGNIDINHESYLMFARVLTNLLTIRTDKGIINELAPGKKAKQIKLTLNNKKIAFKKEEAEIKEALHANRDKITGLVFRHFLPGIKIPDNVAYTKYLDTAQVYICKKLYGIATQYRPYQGDDFRFLEKGENTASKTDAYKFYPKRLEAMLRKMKANPSHITFKFRQAVNFIRNINFYHTRIGRLTDIEPFAEELNKIVPAKEDLIAFIPPSFFNVDIKFGDKGYFHTLSSGEKQNIFSSASWMYHLTNLNSVREDEEAEYNRYDCLNFVFDEIELYYHPEMQRMSVTTFIDNLNRSKLPQGIGINCIFVTHSPFILSDIPNQNILFLTEEGMPDLTAKYNRTFGANIHELLKNNFFLNDGTMGHFAQQKITELISFLKHTDMEKGIWTKESSGTFIDMVSEPLIRQGLRNMYHEKFTLSVPEIDREIERLNRKKQQMKSTEA